MKQQRTLIISVVGLVLVTLTACVQVSPPGATGAVPESVTVAENEVQSGSTYLAANPELMAARRHNGVVKNEAVNGSTFYAANPELMVAGRYTAPSIEHNETSGSEFFAANPEMMAVHRYAAAATEK